MCAKQAAASIRVWLDEFALSGFAYGTTASLRQAVPMARAFSDAGPRRVVGGYDHDHSELGLFDGDAAAIDEIIDNLVGDASDHYLLKAFGGAAAGAVAHEYIVGLEEKPLVGQREDPLLLNWTEQGRGPVYRGIVLANETSTGSENLTGRNQGTTTSGQVYAVTFRLISFTGTSVTMTLEESDDDGDTDPYGAISGITSGALAAAGAVRDTTTAATKAWKRVVLAGTYSSAEVLVTAGVEAGY